MGIKYFSALAISVLFAIAAKRMTYLKSESDEECMVRNLMW